MEDASEDFKDIEHQAVLEAFTSG
jgi:hypothetical protein